ncbi:MAG: hypothetical protein ACLPSL_02980 [Smithella sp.]
MKKKIECQEELGRLAAKYGVRSNEAQNEKLAPVKYEYKAFITCLVPKTRPDLRQSRHGVPGFCGY